MASSKAAGTELRVPEPQVEHLLFFPESQHKYLITSPFLRRGPLSVGVVFGILSRPEFFVFLSFSLCLDVDSKRPWGILILNSHKSIFFFHSNSI